MPRREKKRRKGECVTAVAGVGGETKEREDLEEVGFPEARRVFASISLWLLRNTAGQETDYKLKTAVDWVRRGC